MAKLSRDEILKIAKLSKISLTSDEVLKYQNQLSSVLEYVSQVSELDTSKVNSFSSGNKNRAAKDEPKKSMGRDNLLSNVPKKQDGFIIVPRVIKK